MGTVLVFDEKSGSFVLVFSLSLSLSPLSPF